MYNEALSQPYSLRGDGIELIRMSCLRYNCTAGLVDSFYQSSVGY